VATSDRPALPRSLIVLALLTFVAGMSAAAAQEEGGADTSTRLTAEQLHDFEYRFIGPSNPSGRVTALAVPDTGDHTRMYAGLASGGLWKTTSAGTTWEPIFNDEGTSTIGDVKVAPWNPEVVWVGTGERNSLRSNSWGNGVHRSTDGGHTWEHVGLEETREIGRIAVHPSDSGVAYVAALGHLWGPDPERGVYRTTDAGATWEKVLFVDDTTGFVDLKMHPEDPDVMFAAAWHRIRWGGGHMEGAGEGSGIFRTTDGGDTWTELTDPALDNGLPTEKLGRIGLAIHPREPDLVFAVIQVAHGARSADVSPFGGLFRSRDGGESWERVNDLSAVPDYFYNEVWLDPGDTERLWLAATRLHVSEDGGRGIAPVSLPRVHVDHHALWVDPENSDHRVLGNDGGVYVTRDDGETWSHQIIPAVQFYEVDVDTTKVPYHVCGGTQDNGTWCGPSRTRESVGITAADWYKIFGGDGFHSAVSHDDPTIRYAEYQYGNMVRLDTEAWEYESLQPLAEDAGAESGYAFRWDWNTPFLISDHDPTTLYLGGNHLFRLTDRGEDWEILGPDMTRQSRLDPEPEVGHTSYGSLHSVAESALDASVLWTGSNDGLLWVSVDGGETWTDVTANLPGGGPTPPCWVSEIETSRFDARTAYVTYDCHRRDDYAPYVYRTDDAGETWTEITGDLPEDASSFVIKQGHRNEDLLFVGTATGVYVSVEEGGRWVRLGDGLPTVEVKDLEVVPRARELAVATYGRGMYVLGIGPLEELTTDVMDEAAHLFPVADARQYRLASTYGEFGDAFFRTGAVEPSARISYWVGEEHEGEASVEIRKAPEEGAGDAAEAGDVDAEERGEPIASLSGSGEVGLHTVSWDLTRDEPRPRRLGDPTSSFELRRVLPGAYTVTLEVGDRTMTETFEVLDGWERRTPGRVR
jgi:photosystem II stability/assembly factor-like uncharacterized protein